MVDQRIIRHVAAQTGLGVKFVAKDEQVSLLLSQLTNVLSKQFVLKGGTALNRVFLDQKRFSEDIDFDVIGEEPREDKLTLIEQRIENITGFEVEGPRKMKDVVRYDCFYTNVFGDKDRVMLEFNLSITELQAAQTPQKHLITSHILPSEPAHLPIYGFEDLVARKIICLLERMDGKDIFDLFFAFEYTIDKKQLLQAVHSLGYGTEAFERSVERLVLFEEHAIEIGNAANHYIPRNMRPNWHSFIKTLQHRIYDLIDEFA